MSFYWYQNRWHWTA